MSVGNIRQCYGIKKHGALFYSCSDLYNQIAGLGAKHLVNDTYYYVILLIADRAKKISEELLKLWEKLSFPVISQQQVLAKVDKLIKVFEKYRKRPNKGFEKNLPHIFDITKQSGNWLCSEDKELYRNQIESGGRVGYTTKKVASISTIHPSKRPRSSSELSTNQVQDFSSSTNTEEDKSCTDSDVAEESSTLKRKYKRTKSAAKLVSKVSLSTRKASNVLENLAEEELDVARPSQSGIWRRVIKDVDKVKARLKNLIINEEEFCLNFDLKRIDNKEYQVDEELLKDSQSD